MAQLTFEISNQIISRTDGFRVVADSANYLYAQFVFATEDWSEFGSPTAVFTQGDVSYRQLLDDDGTCVVPWEVLTGYSYFTVSVFAGSRITANTARVLVEASGYTDSSTSPDDPTPTVYEQIIARMDEAEENIEELTDRAETAATAAEESADSAAESAAAAAASETSAATSEANAAASAAAAAASETSAATSEANAAASAAAASASETSAATSEANAAASAAAASGSAEDASNSATEARTYRDQAASYATFSIGESPDTNGLAIFYNDSE